MKRKNRVISRVIFFSVMTMVTLLAENGEVVGGDNNGEVILEESCFKNKNSAEKCLEKIYPKISLDKITIYRYLDKALKVLTGGRGNSYTVDENITLSDQERFIIYADISEAKKPISTNILQAKVTQTQTHLIVDIATKDINNSVIIRNKDNEILIKYNVTK